MDKELRVFLLIFFMAPFFLYGCGIQVPADKVQYVGEWQSPEMYLLITQDGSVKYKRIKGGMTKSVSGPLRGFEGDNFIVGLPAVSTTFVVSEGALRRKGPMEDGG